MLKISLIIKYDLLKQRFTLLNYGSPPTCSPPVEAPVGSFRAHRRCNAPLAALVPSGVEQSPPAVSSCPAGADKPAAITQDTLDFNRAFINILTC